MNQLELYELRDGVCCFRDGTQPCPGCSEVVTFLTSNQGQSLDVLHPNPPCPGFRGFVERLWAAHAENQRSSA